VLITGESGTGKELIARAIHFLSPRKDLPFVKVNCAAIPSELIESELFGYEKGAFTGAQSRKKGLFEQANGGTLFLDEIGDMSLDAQAKVLRALQSGEITRVGSEHTVLVDVRVLAATNRDLELAVSEGRFREDLYFRLSVVPVRSPSLRERREDIPALALSFARAFSKENGVREKHIDGEVLDALAERAWPGNVRELKNVVERMVILSGDTVTLDDLPPEGRIRETSTLEPQPAQSSSTSTRSSSGSIPPEPTGGERLTLREFRDKAEADYITATLKAYDWNISRASVVLGVERTNLHKKMRALNIRRDGGESN
jgi:two-component system nitrogen regulation response regulator NtrX